MRESRVGTMFGALAMVLGLALTLTVTVGAADAAILIVDNDGVECPAPDHATITAAVAAAAANDTIEICAGTYAEAAIVVTQPVIFVGQDRDTVIVDTTGLHAFHVQSGGVTFRDLTMATGNEGIRIESVPPSGTLSNLLIENVVFRDFTGDAIEVHGFVTVNDLVIRDTEFDNNLYGMRISSSSIVDGLTIETSSFTGAAGNSIGIYLANDANIATLSNMQVTGSSFDALGLGGLFLEEVDNSVISGNTFTGNHSGIIINKIHATSGQVVEELLISGNTFIDQTRRPIFFNSSAAGIGANVVVDGNTILQDVGALLPTGNTKGMIDFRGSATQTHQEVRITNNDLTLSGVFVSPITAAYGIHLIGDGPYVIEGNRFDGGGVGDASGIDQPPTAGIFIQTVDSTNGERTESVTITCNDIRNFIHGITLYDRVPPGQPGHLADGTSVVVTTTNLVGNQDFGIANAGDSEDVLANGNFWGSATGPSGAGPGSGDAITANVIATQYAASAFTEFCAPSSALEIPTLNEWALVGLASLMSLGGWLVLRRRRYQRVRVG